MAELLVDKHKTLLIIGKGKTKYAMNEIVYSEDEEEVLSHYGESDLSKAFSVAKDFGAPHVFLMNIQSDQDYFDVADVLKQNDFAYVVFASLYMSDTFRDTYSGGLIRSYLAYLMGYIGLNHLSTFVITDKHASLYEDVDAFMGDMNSVQNRFLGHCSGRANLQNLIFVANNLIAYENAAVVIAAMLCATDPKDYPVSEYFGGTVFYINQWDNPGSMVYFHQNTCRETTIENFLNMSRNNDDPQKLVYIDRIVKRLCRDMDFQALRGRFYSAYQKLEFSRMLTEYLTSVQGELIKAFNIDSINAYKGEPGTITLSARISVVPMNCLETLSVTKEIEVS